MRNLYVSVFSLSRLSFQSVRQSPYVQAILRRLQPGQVLNRSDLLTGEADAERDEHGSLGGILTRFSNNFN